MSIRRTPIRRALYRPNLMLGGERAPVLSISLVCGGLALWSMNLVAIVICGVVWFVVVGALRHMAKSDPMFCKVYWRSRQYRVYHPGRSTPWR